MLTLQDRGMSTHPHEICLQHFSYDPNEGILRSRDYLVDAIDPRNGRQAIMYFGRMKPTSHVIWYYMTGKFPEKGKVIDHVNRDPSDNKWKNLRKCTKKDNAQNTNLRNSYYKNMFLAHVNFKTESIDLGWFPTIQEALIVRERGYELIAQGKFNPLSL